MSDPTFNNAEESWAYLRPFINVAALAKAIGISRTAIYEWRRVPPRRLAIVSDILFIPVWVLDPNAPYNPRRSQHDNG